MLQSPPERDIPVFSLYQSQAMLDLHNIQVLEKKLGHHSSSDYWTCSIEAPRSLLGVQYESTIYAKARHCEK